MELQKKSSTQSVDGPFVSTASVNLPAEPIPNATGSVVKSVNEKETGLGGLPDKGVVLVTSADPTIFAVAIAAIVKSIHVDGTVADLPVCSVSKITFLHVPGSHDAESVKSYAAKELQAGKLLAQPIRHCRRFNPLSFSALPYIMRFLTPGTGVLIPADYEDLTHDEAIAALVDLNAAAVKNDTILVIFLQHEKKRNVMWLRNYCMAAVDARKCEPGPRALTAVVLDNVTLASEHLRGIGRAIIEVFRDPKQGWIFQQEPFIAERAVIRLAWYLAHEGMKLRDVAKIVGIAASNISRGFQALLIQPKSAGGFIPPANWRARWALDYDLNEDSPGTMQELVDALANPHAAKVAGEKGTSTDSPRSTGSNVSAELVAPSSTRENREV
ncbi:hypothetical protein ACR42A_32500 [Burkholderia gladioli]|uniref:hypothetical protein n=1 Tax=Burkholderia gladioli TaxID=28095 RepID=UPI003DA29F8A